MNVYEKYGLSPFGAIPNERQKEHFEYKKAFFHFGVNTFTNAEWGDGTEKEKAFSPTDLDIGQWIRAIKAAGFDLAIITAKHHDGFCLWPSAYTEHSVKNSPYKGGKGDVIKEFTDACRKYGVKAGVYISPWDRSSPYWGSPEYSSYYADQLTELMTGYGEISEVWWDGAGSSETVYDWGRWAYIIREHQPKAAIFGSMGASPYIDFRWVGNEIGKAGDTHFACIDDSYITCETPEKLNTGTAGASRYIPSETDVSIRPGWFYHEDQDAHVKSASKLNEIWFDSVGKNSMLLLNFPPDRRGLINEKDAKNALLSHRCISKMLSVNYAAGASLKASSVLCDALSPERAVLDGEMNFYASEKDCLDPVIDIILDGENEINVFILGEVINLGERITGFKLESVTEEGTTVLFEGTSVGHLRAVRIPSARYKHLRLSITHALASPVIARLGLHYFEDITEEGSVIEKQNLASGCNSSIELSDDGKTAYISFGGIFDFDTVGFALSEACEFQIRPFNGATYGKSMDFVSETDKVLIKLDSKISGCYRLMITAKKPFANDPKFDIR